MELEEGMLNMKSSENCRISELEVEINKIEENGKYLEEITELRINRKKLKLTVDQYGRSLVLAVKFET